MDADLAVLRAFFARAPFMADLGIEPFACEPCRVRTRMAVQIFLLDTPPDYKPVG